MGETKAAKRRGAEHPQRSEAGLWQVFRAQQRKKICKALNVEVTIGKKAKKNVDEARIWRVQK